MRKNMRRKRVGSRGWALIAFWLDCDERAGLMVRGEIVALLRMKMVGYWILRGKMGFVHTG